MTEVLRVSGLSKTYPGFRLKNVSFSVEKGAVMGFIGRNGAGKSTTLKAILGMVHPDGGRVEILGTDFAGNETAVKASLGVVLGGIDFYPKKTVKTIAAVTKTFYPDWDEDKYRYYLELFAIDETKRVDALSSGMKVKFLIALALSHGAKLLILDEPTSGLDPVSRDELCTLFRAIAGSGKCSILFSTHVTSDLEKCATHITFIRDGEIQHTGTLAEFKAHYADPAEPGKEPSLEEIIVNAERSELSAEAIR